jgi:hypothetical protein
VFVAYANHVGSERDLDYIGYAESRSHNTYQRDRRPELYRAIVGPE